MPYLRDALRSDDELVISCATLTLWQMDEEGIRELEGGESGEDEES